MNLLDADSLKSNIEILIETDINPALESHDGGILLEKVEYHDAVPFVYISFHGGCHGCQTSKNTTFRFIENHLRNELNAQELILVNIDDDHCVT